MLKKILSLVGVVYSFSVFSMENQLEDLVVAEGLGFRIGNLLITPVDTESNNVQSFKEVYNQFELNQYGYKVNPDLLVQRSDERKQKSNPLRLYLAEGCAVQFGTCPNFVDQKNPFSKQIEAEYVKKGVGIYDESDCYKAHADKTWAHILPIIPDNIEGNAVSYLLGAFVKLGDYFAVKGFTTPTDQKIIGLSFHLNPDDRAVKILQEKGFQIVSPEGVYQDSWLYPNGDKRIMLVK